MVLATLLLVGAAPAIVARLLDTHGTPIAYVGKEKTVFDVEKDDSRIEVLKEKTVFGVEKE